MNTNQTVTSLIATALCIGLCPDLGAQAAFRFDNAAFGPSDTNGSASVRVMSRRQDIRSIAGRNANARAVYVCENSLELFGALKMFNQRASLASVDASSLAVQGRGSAPAAHYTMASSAARTFNSVRLRIAGQTMVSRSHSLNAHVKELHYRTVMTPSKWSYTGPVLLRVNGRVTSGGQLDVSARSFTVSSGPTTIASRYYVPGPSSAAPHVQSIVFGKARVWGSASVTLRTYSPGALQPGVVESRMRLADRNANPYFGSNSATGLFGRVRVVAASLVLKLRVRVHNLKWWYRTLYNDAKYIREVILPVG